MKLHRRLCVSLAAAALALVAAGSLHSATAQSRQSPRGTQETNQSVAAVGSRLINADGDTVGKCLETTASGGNWAAVYMNGCHSNAHQSWYLTPHTGNVWAIRSHDPDAAGRCLTAPVFEGNPAKMADCETVGGPQAWFKEERGDEWFRFRNKVYPDQCLDVRGNGESTVVQTWLCGPMTGPDVKGNQFWHWHSVG